MLSLQLSACSLQLLLAVLEGLLKAVVPVQVHPGDDVRQLGGLVKDHYCVVQRHVHVWQLPVILGCTAEWQLPCQPNTAHYMQPVLARLPVHAQDEICCGTVLARPTGTDTSAALLVQQVQHYSCHARQGCCDCMG